MLRYAQEKLAEMGGDGMMGGMIAMMLPPERLASLIEPAGEKMQKYVKEQRTGIHPPGAGTESR